MTICLDDPSGAARQARDRARDAGGLALAVTRGMKSALAVLFLVACSGPVRGAYEARHRTYPVTVADAQAAATRVFLRNRRIGLDTTDPRQVRSISFCHSEDAHPCSTLEL